MGIECNILGLEFIDKDKQYTYISNHQNALDILMDNCRNIINRNLKLDCKLNVKY